MPQADNGALRDQSGGGDRVEILEERVAEDYEPTENEIEEYAEWLGMDAFDDRDLLWIARQGLKTPLPKPWKPCESGQGEIFYFNPETGESKWDHPCDEQLRQLYAKHKDKQIEQRELADRGDGASDVQQEAADPSNAEDAAGDAHGSCLASDGTASQRAGSALTKHVVATPSVSSCSVAELAGKLTAKLPAPLPPLSLPPGKEDGGPVKSQPSWEAVLGQDCGVDSLFSTPLDLRPPPLAGVGALRSTGEPVVVARAVTQDSTTSSSSGASTTTAPDAHVAPVAPQRGSLWGLPPQPPRQHIANACAGGGSRTQGDFMSSHEQGDQPAHQPLILLTPTMHQHQQASRVTTPVDGQVTLESLSPPTPELASILAAELRPEELRPEEQLSLWSQIEDSVKLPTHLSCEGSLELSSLSAVLEQSPDSPGGAFDGDKSMVEELRRMDSKERSIGNSNSQTAADARAAETAVAAAAEELSALKMELAARARECEELRVEARSTKCSAAATVAVTAASEERPASQGRTEVAAEQTADDANSVDTAASGTAPKEAQSRREGSAHAVEQLQEELCALAARIRNVEDGKARKDEPTGEASGSRGVCVPSDARSSPGLQDMLQDTGSAQVAQLQARIGDSERMLQEARLTLQQELSAHALTQTNSREHQREAIRLETQLKHKQAEVDRSTLEVQRCQTEHADRDSQHHELQLQLQTRDAELSKLRVQLTAQARQNDATLQQQRLELREREQLLNDRERFLDERERLMGEAELRIHRQQREVRADLQRAELGGLRATLSEVTLSGPRHPASPGVVARACSSSVVGRRSAGAQRALSARAHPPEGGDSEGIPLMQRTLTMAEGAMHCSNPGATLKRGISLPAEPRAQTARAHIAASMEGLCSPEGIAFPTSDDSNTQTTPQCAGGKGLTTGTPSSASSTVSLRESKECYDVGGLGDDVLEDGRPSLSQVSAGLSPEQAAGNAVGADAIATLISGRSVKDMSDVLRARRRELRSEHSALEEERRLWRSEARKVRKQGDDAAAPAAKHESVADARSALDTRAAALNKSIEEYRALEQLISGHMRLPRQQAVLGHPLESHLLHIHPLQSKAASQEDKLRKRWPQVLDGHREQHGDFLLAAPEHSAKQDSKAFGRPSRRPRAASVGGA